MLSGSSEPSTSDELETESANEATLLLLCCTHVTLIYGAKNKMTASAMKLVMHGLTRQNNAVISHTLFITHFKKHQTI